MLGFGHTPDAVLEAMARPQVMANIMTPSLSQQRFITALRAEIGHRRGGCPFARFMCLNSGSEAVGLAARIADVNAKLQTDPGARHAGATIKRVVVGQLPWPHRPPGAVLRFQPQELHAAPGQLPRRGLGDHRGAVR